jgi:hypothetical protein
MLMAAMGVSDHPGWAEILGATKVDRIAGAVDLVV